METMETMDKYNGFENRETWLINLWLNNDERLYDGASWIAADVMMDHGTDDTADRVSNCTYYMSVRLRQWVEDLTAEAGEDLPSGPRGIVADVLSGALSVVNWESIARSFIETAIIDYDAMDDDETGDDADGETEAE